MFKRVLKTFLVSLIIGCSALSAKATIHVILVWDGYLQFMPQGSDPYYLGDTIQWLPLDHPAMIHTITSTQIPEGAASFDVFWQAPADTFFQYIPAVAGNYNYVCLPHETSGMAGHFTIHEPLGIEGIAEENAMLVFPNPTQEKLYVRKEAQGEQFRIFRLNGQIIREGQIDAYIDVSQLATGIYIVELVGDRRRLIKFVKE